MISLAARGGSADCNGRQRLTTSVAGVDFMPVLHGGLTESPAEVHLPPSHLSWEVNEANVEALEFDTKIIELTQKPVDLRGERLRLALERLGAGIRLVGTSVRGLELELLHALAPDRVVANDVFDDPSDEREGPVGFFDCEALRHTGIVSVPIASGQVQRTA